MDNLLDTFFESDVLTKSVKTLSMKIKNCEFKNFISICDNIIKILDALKYLHKRGFLHLNLTPDNIYFSDKGFVWLIGNSSVFCLGDDLQKYSSSFRTGYSANELYCNEETKPLPLHYTTDLYSISAIFFRILVGRIPKDGDWSKRTQWQLNNQSGYLTGASNLLVRKINDFLVKGLSLIPTRRFKNIEEMQKEIFELKRQAV